MGLRDLTNTTFVVPCKITDEYRMRNMELSMSFIRKHFATYVVVVEQDGDSTASLCASLGLRHVRHDTPDGVFHKTRLLNIGYSLASTRVVASYDIDVLFPPSQCDFAEKYILQDVVDAVYPYDGRFLHVPETMREMISSEMSVDNVDIAGCECVSTVSPGGALFMDLGMFRKCGLENEAFLSWGPEDLEREKRIQKLGYRLSRLQGPLFHMWHPPSPHANFNNEYYNMNHQEFMRMLNTPKDAMEYLVSTWKPTTHGGG